MKSALVGETLFCKQKIKSKQRVLTCATSVFHFVVHFAKKIFRKFTDFSALARAIYIHLCLFILCFAFVFILLCKCMQFYFFAPFALRLKWDIIEGLGCMHDIPSKNRYKLMQCFAKMKMIRWNCAVSLERVAAIKISTYLLFSLHTDKAEEEFLQIEKTTYVN